LTLWVGGKQNALNVQLMVIFSGGRSVVKQFFLPADRGLIVVRAPVAALQEITPGSATGNHQT
jgi:hypothetical protein